VDGSPVTTPDGAPRIPGSAWNNPGRPFVVCRMTPERRHPMTRDPGPDCRRLAALIERDLDGELTPEQRRFTEAHLSSCPACRARRGFQADLRAHLDAALSAGDLPLGLTDRVLDLLEREERAMERGTG